MTIFSKLATGAVRNGATGNPNQRASAYKNSGYSGTMYIAKTSNMNASENRLLNHHSGRHNVHQHQAMFIQLWARKDLKDK